MSVAWLKEVLQIDGTVLDELKIVQEGDWSQEHKWQHKSTVVQLTGEENFDPENWPVDSVLEPGFYQINSARNGSYHTDWDYDEDVVFKVEPYQETVTKYAAVK